MAGATAVHEAVRLETALVPTDLLFAALDSMGPEPSPASHDASLSNGVCLLPLVALLDLHHARFQAGATGRRSGAWWTPIASFCGVPVGPIPVGLIFQATELLSNRLIRLRITGTTKSPHVQVEALQVLSEEAVRFFLTRALVP